MADTTRRRPSPNVVAVVVLALLTGSLLLWQRPWQSSDAAIVAIPDDAGSVLAEQFRTLSGARTEADFAAAAGTTPAAGAFAREAWAARNALGARDVELRYLNGGEVADRRDGSTEASVEVSWRPGDDSGLAATTPRTSSVKFRLDPQPDGTFAVRGVRALGDALPIWLSGDVTVTRKAGTTVIRVDGGDPDLPVEAMAATARATVERVVPSAAGTVTVVSPRSPRQLAALVGTDEADIAQIAAVTTSLDGRSGAVSGTVIVLNPTVFATMDPRAAQVVVSHEATHLMTSAVGTSAATWVIEGFADFVALHDDTAPLSVSAGQILRQVRAGNPPTALPSTGDFDATGRGLGAVYESAWMIFRLLGERAGDARIVSFYEAVRDGAPLGRALRSSFNLSEKTLTTDWLRYLSKSASTVS